MGLGPAGCGLVNYGKTSATGEISEKGCALKIQGCKTKHLILSITHMKKSCFFFVLTIAAFLLGSCNTFIGMGRDIQGLGAGIQNQGTTGSWDGTGSKPQASNPYGAPAAQ